MKPFIKEVSFKEAVDIDNTEDFDLAEALVEIRL
jgi:CMP-N-acetylneuraminic acid synthetase